MTRLSAEAMAVQAALARARGRLRTLGAEGDARVVKKAACSLCKAKRGQRCVKGGWADMPGSGPARPPHAERRRAAKPLP